MLYHAVSKNMQFMPCHALQYIAILRGAAGAVPSTCFACLSGAKGVFFGSLGFAGEAVFSATASDGPVIHLAMF